MRASILLMLLLSALLRFADTAFEAEKVVSSLNSVEFTPQRRSSILPLSCSASISSTPLRTRSISS